MHLDLRPDLSAADRRLVLSASGPTVEVDLGELGAGTWAVAVHHERAQLAHGCGYEGHAIAHAQLAASSAAFDGPYGV